MMRPGFTLLEVLIAIAVGSMLGVLLFTMVTQVTNNARIVSGVMDVHTRMIIAMRQLERDISGAMIPTQESAPATTASDKDATSQASKKVSKVFYNSMKNDQLEFFTFITNNPLQRVWENAAGVPVPRCVRVVYRLKPDTSIKKGEKQYILTRQELSDLNADLVLKDGSEAAKKYRTYEMIDGVLSFKLKFQQREDGDKKTNAEKKDVMVWDSDSKLDNGKERPAQNMVPEVVYCEFVLSDNQKGKHKVIISIPILPDMTSLDAKQAAASPPKEAASKQPPAPPVPDNKPKDDAQKNGTKVAGNAAGGAA